MTRDVPRATCYVLARRRLGEGGRRATSYVLFIGLASVLLAAQQPATPYRIERPIVSTGAGPQRLEVDVPLLAHAQRFTMVRPLGSGEWRADGGLSDLRIVDGQDREVAYLLVHPTREPAWVPAVMLPVAATKKSSGFEADLGDVRSVDTLVVEGLPVPFLKRLVLEGSGDRTRWTMLAAEGTLFDLPQERLRQLSVPFATGAYRYLRVTWDDTNSGRLPTPARVRARAVAADSVPHASLTTAVPFQRRASEPGRSRYRLKLPAAGLPIVAVTLDVGPGHVFRTASIVEARFQGSQAAPVMLGRETLARIERDGVTASALRVPITIPGEAEIELVIDDGSNPPLDLKGVAVEMAELPWIYFESTGGPLKARYGSRAVAAPVYDLEAVRGALKLSAVPQARWGEPIDATPPAPASPPTPLPGTGAEIDVAAFQYRRSIPSVAGGLTVLPLDVAVLAHSRGPAYSFADVRVADQAGKQVPYLLERRDEPIALPLELRSSAAPRIPALRSEPGHNRSVYSVTLPYSPLPAPRLVLETSDRVFQRSVQVVVERPADRSHRDAWLDVLAGTEWQHASPDVPAPAAVLALAGAAHDGRDLLIVVDEGDNRPLAITKVQLLLPSWRVRFFSPAAGQTSLTLLYGQDQLAPPRYDLALLAPQVMGAEAREVEAAPEPSAVSDSAPALIAPRTFWIGLSAAVLVLLGIIAKLVAGSSAAPSPPSPPGP